jgi:hypothetical protein
VVVREATDVVLERVHARGGDDAGLAHGAAEDVLLAPGAFDQRARPGEEGAERAPEPLRQAERDSVETRGDLGGIHVERHGRVQEPRPVEVHRDPDLACRRHHGLERVERPDPASRVVVGVLEREHRDPLVGGLRARLAGLAHLLGHDPAGDASEADRHQPGVGGRAAVLVDDDVRGLVRQKHVTRAAVELERDLVRHRRGREEDGGLLSEQARDPPLELEHGQVLPLLLVTDHGFGDRAPHLGRREGHRVRAEVDHAGDATVT